MSYSTVMVYVDANGSQEQRVRLAASLADKFNATLIGLSALPIPPPFIFEGGIIQRGPEAAIGQMMAMFNTKEEWFPCVAAANQSCARMATDIGLPDRCAGARGAERGAPILSSSDKPRFQEIP
jgi:hypothetical protein